MVFWIGVGITTVGMIVYALTRLTAGGRMARDIGRNADKLQRMLDSGEARKFGEGSEELFRDAIAYQREHQVEPVLHLSKLSLIMVLLGAAIALFAYLSK